MKFYFVNTCYACPEQYDVYRDNGQICAYVRLRWGNLYAEYPSIDGEVIYNTHFSDNSKGNFDNDNERNHYLKEISEAIKDKIVENMHIDYKEIDTEYEYLTDISQLEERIGKSE